MKILGIETSCDETAAAVIEVENDQIKVLSNVVSSQVKLHAEFGGVVPSLAAREHEKNLPAVLMEALRLAKLAQGHQIDFADIDLVAVTSGPGLAPALWRGVNFANDLAKKHDKPIIGVNHMEGHIYSNWLKPIGVMTNDEFLIPNEKHFPALCLIVSGGHTQLTLMKDHPPSLKSSGEAGGNYETIGSTLDDAAGEAFDKIARILELGYPGGPAVAAEAAKFPMTNFPAFAEASAGRQFPKKIELPRPMIHSKNYNFSFSGLKTAVLYLVHDLTKVQPLGDWVRMEIAHEAQEAIVDVLVSKTMRAAEEYSVSSIMLSGGVSANRLLREKLKAISYELGIPVFTPAMQYTTDNAAMIATAAYFNSRQADLSRRNFEEVKADANLEIF